jgi:signal transduction histidine kinase
MTSEQRDWRARCETLEREVTELASAISHDLRAPLRAVDGFARAVERQYAASLDAEARVFLAQIRQGAQNLARHIDALVQLARLSVAPLQRQMVELDPIARQLADELRARAPERPVQLEIQSGLAIEADPTLVRRLLEVLLDNAWTATRDQPVARIAVGRDSGGQRGFYVRDNGEGFDRGQATRLFEPFARVHPSREGEGLGVGLAVARRIVSRHGGTIDAEALPGKGATFRFTLSP